MTFRERDKQRGVNSDSPLIGSTSERERKAREKEKAANEAALQHKTKNNV